MEDIEVTIIEDDLPLKAPPLHKGQFKAWDTPDSTDVRIICAQKVIEAVQEHATKNQNYRREVGGMLLGDAYRHEGVIYIEITEYIAAHDRPGQQSSSVHFTFTPEIWAEMWRVKDRDYDPLRVVGWFHSHPGHGIFLSPSMDKEIHSKFFNHRWQTAMVFDPVRHEGGFFVWQNSQIKRAPGFFELFDPDRHESIVQWKNLPKPKEIPIPAPSPQPSKKLAWITLTLVGIVFVMSLCSLLNTNRATRAIRATEQRIESHADTLEREVNNLATAVAANAEKIDEMGAPMAEIAQTQTNQGATIASIQSQLASLQAAPSLETVTLAPTVTRETATSTPTITPTQETVTSTLPITPTRAPITGTLTTTPTQESVTSTVTITPTQETTVITPTDTSTPIDQREGATEIRLKSNLYVKDQGSNPEGVFEMPLDTGFEICIPLTISGTTSADIELWIEFVHQQNGTPDRTESQTLTLPPSDDVVPVCFERKPGELLDTPGVWEGYAHFKSEDGIELKIPPEDRMEPDPKDAVTIEIIGD